MSCNHDFYDEFEVDGQGKDKGEKVAIYKCKDCGMLSKNRCEVYSRVVGYIRPVNYWNKGKKEEYKERKIYSPKHFGKEIEPHLLVKPLVTN